MDFKNIPKKYRPIPFWSWNEKLDTEETKRQVKVMDEAGIGGFFMHARGGLQTEYMKKEWFDNVTAATEEAEERSMYPWAYDENGWPSGFGGGIVNGMGVKYQQKYLRMEDENNHPDTFICECAGKYFYYEINPFYVDTLDKEVIATFIDKIYKPYYEKYQNRICGFFTDEPQISRSGTPWSFVFEDEYKKRYGENINEHLHELFLDVDDFKATRVKFWLMVTELFSDNFMKQIYDWCSERGLKLTGHLVLEETFNSQIETNGACMPHYEYFHIPGMDWLGRNIFDCLTAKQVSTVAEQFGKKQVLSETFALSSHDASFDILKRIYEWQMVRGINLLCQHLEGYSLRGIRKRDYPPAMFCQQPWWEYYNAFNDAMSRIGMIMAEGEKTADVLVVSTISKAWSMYDGEQNSNIEDAGKSFLDILVRLEKKHILYHIGDELIMRRHAKVENGKLIIGNQSYSKIIAPENECMLDSTQKLLDEFRLSGGIVVSEADFEPKDVIDNENITYNKSVHPDFTAHYFVNSTEETQKAVIGVKGKKLNIITGDLEDFDGHYTFAYGDSLMIIEDGSSNIQCEEKEKEYIALSSVGHIVSVSDNALTLDYCDYYFDGELQEKNGYVLNIAQRANNLCRPVDIHMDFKTQINYIPEKLILVCETPWIFDISVNGKKISSDHSGYFADKSFKKIDITDYVKCGENVISLECRFSQSAEVYENIEKSKIFESEKNKLNYDMEIESIYLIGDFSVGTNGNWTENNNLRCVFDGSFSIEAPKRDVPYKRLEKNGYPFFCGKMTFEETVCVTGDNPVLKLERKGINVVHLEANGKSKTCLWCADEIPVADILEKGENKLKITIVNNLKNLLGPHHMVDDVTLGIGPSSFFKEPCVWNMHPEKNWADGYNFAQTGI